MNEINKIKQESIRKGMSKKVIERDNSKEFFRFTNGNLEEYDLMRYRGNIVLLNKEELDCIKRNKQEA